MIRTKLHQVLKLPFIDNLRHAIPTFSSLPYGFGKKHFGIVMIRQRVKAESGVSGFRPARRAGQPNYTPTPSQRWLTFLHNHSRATCDFFCRHLRRTPHPLFAIDAGGGTRKIRHCNVTAHLSAGWTLQQFREALRDEHVPISS